MQSGRCSCVTMDSLEVCFIKVLMAWISRTLVQGYICLMPISWLDRVGFGIWRRAEPRVGYGNKGFNNAGVDINNLDRLNTYSERFRHQ
jgi:hypothetical protein